MDNDCILLNGVVSISPRKIDKQKSCRLAGDLQLINVLQNMKKNYQNSKNQMSAFLSGFSC